LVHPGPWRFLPIAYVALHIGQFKPKPFVPALENCGNKRRRRRSHL